ncbi:hypothetical protein BD779DRAFT_627026 [Infundibulicybe gibba]|nr:hypothetical protein BD779DRAFT_627026 [Infundibulicybe gibba]
MLPLILSPATLTPGAAAAGSSRAPRTTPSLILPSKPLRLPATPSLVGALVTPSGKARAANARRVAKERMLLVRSLVDLLTAVD